MPYCINHPATDTTQFCSQCGYPFCGSCLVDFLGQAHCGACRDRRLVSMQTPVSTTAPFQGTNQVDISRWIEGGWRIVSQDLGSWIGATLLCFLLGTLCFPILPMLMGGMVLMACQKLTRGYVTFDTFWSGFRRSGPLLASTACYVLFWGLLVGVYLGIMWLPVAFLGNSEASSVVAVLGLVGYYILMPALGIAGAPLLFFSFHHVAIRGVDPLTAVRDSIAVVRRNFLMYLVTNLVFQVISYLGTLACLVGVLFTTPLYVAAATQAYADHFGVEGWDQ